MFDKILSSVGIGSAKIDTVFDKVTVCPGEILSGTVHITGGSAQQEVDQIYLNLVTKTVKKVDGKSTYSNEIKNKFIVSDAFTIDPHDELYLDFKIQLPYDCPLSTGQGSSYFVTGLDIDYALDPDDKDKIQVVPESITTSLFNEIASLGFRHTKESGKVYSKHGVLVQEFEFIPQGGEFRQYLDELEVVIHGERDYLDLSIQVDRKAVGVLGTISEYRGTDETYYHTKLYKDRRYPDHFIRDLIIRALRRAY